jgi:hypothetical protein
MPHVNNHVKRFYIVYTLRYTFDTSFLCFRHDLLSVCSQNLMMDFLYTMLFVVGMWLITIAAAWINQLPWHPK